MAKTVAKEERLDKVLAKLLDISRKQASALIKDGRILVNDALAQKGQDKVAPEDLIYLDEELIEAAGLTQQRRVLLFNKPTGCICADRDKRYPLVLNYLIDVPHREMLHCAGRLDLDACGLIIVTDDGALIHEITAPKKQIAKIYFVTTDVPIPPKATEALARGVKHPEESERYRPALLHRVGERAALVQVTEGRYHEVKRLMQTQGCEVTHLERLAIGALCLPPTLGRGQFYQLTEEEVALMFVDPAPLTEVAAQYSAYMSTLMQA